MKEVLNDSNDEVKSAAICNLGELVNIIPSLVSEIFIILKEVLHDSSDEVKIVVIWSLIETVRVNPSLAQEVFNILKELLTSPNDYIKFASIENFIRLVNIIPSLAQETFNIFRELIKNPNTNKHINSEVIGGFSYIIQANPELAQEIFAILKKLIHTSNIKPNIIMCLGWIVLVNPSLVQEILEILNTLLNNPSNYIEFTIAKILGWIIQINPNISHEVSKILKNLFSNSDYIIKSESALSLVELGKVKPAEEAFKVFKDILSDPYVDRYARYEAIWNLIEILKVILLNKEGHKQVNELFKIIYLTKIEEFQFDKDLHTEAKTTLNKITAHITQEYEKSKNPKVIEWFTESFNELPNINETRIFLKEICKSILKSGVINEYESKFILNCIKNIILLLRYRLVKNRE